MCDLSLKYCSSIFSLKDAVWIFYYIKMSNDLFEKTVKETDNIENFNKERTENTTSVLSLLTYNFDKF